MLDEGKMRGCVAKERRYRIMIYSNSQKCLSGGGLGKVHTPPSKVMMTK